MRRLLPHRIGALFALVGAAVLAHNGRGSVPTAVLFALVGMAVVVVAVKVRRAEAIFQQITDTTPTDPARCGERPTARYYR